VSDLFSFPNPVNELAARTVAAGVLVLTVLTLVLSLAVSSDWLALAALLAYGFVARVLSGPTFSPLGQFATRVVAPRLGPPRLVAGPPKRFAQGMGAVLSLSAVVAHFGFGADGLAELLVGAIVIAATLESVFAYCLGCKVFALLMRAGLIPEATCLACANISLARPAATSSIR
jgi:Domain of unknown function (DUF4395)